MYNIVADISKLVWRGARVVEGTCLENKRAGNGTVGSNPTLSAKFTYFGITEEYPSG